MKSVAVFGSTGSIGVQTLSVCAAHRELFNVTALVFGGSNIEKAVEQIREFRPGHVGVFSESAAKTLADEFPDATFICGDEVWSIAAEPGIDIVVNGVSGFSGIFPLLAALEAGKHVALANKESVVCAPALVRAAMQSGGGVILPVDSEQSAIFQCLASGRRQDLKRLILTASGGPFKDYSIEQLKAVTPLMAMHHPTWNMGKKITIDSATLFNKGLEVMEAAFLFDAAAEEIDVLIHPQSVVHSMVEYADGSVIAQLGVPDMRLAIQYAMTYPERTWSPAKQLDLTAYSGLTFQMPDACRFPAIELAYRALRTGGSLPVAYNSANEVAVSRFVNNEIGFMDIADCVLYAMDRMPQCSINDLDMLLSLDKEARRLASEFGGVNN